MKILVLGDIEHARDLFRQQPGRTRQVHHCTKYAQGDRSFSPSGSPDWVLIEGNAISREGIALIQSLCTMDFYLPPAHPSGDAQDMTHPPRSSSTHNRSPGDDRGFDNPGRELEQILKESRGQKKNHSKKTQTALRFEYQAPPRRRSN